jgi:hypothetical protein
MTRSKEEQIQADRDSEANYDHKTPEQEEATRDRAADAIEREGVMPDARWNEPEGND